jgi:hypothetical protein
VSNIYKLIEHLVENWQNNLFEALSPNVKQQLINKFKQEADDFNIEITDKQLSDYIDFFDSRLKNNPKVTEKDLNKYTLQSLIKLVSSFKGSTSEEGEEIEVTPDVVYNENGLIIYNGSNEDNCLKFGKGESWCITRGSFASYRYDSNRKNPTFYLVKDTNLPSNDRKSFFVVVVGSDNTYKCSDRSNNDIGGRGTEWERWEPWSFVEQNFPSVQGLQRYFKYIPISRSEKLSQEYKSKEMSIGEWLKSPFAFKEQYLVVRKGKKLFSDITNQSFITKVLPKQPQIAEMVAKNYGYIDIKELLQEFDSFSTQNQKSIIANASRFTKVDPNIIESDAYPWSAKKAIVKSNLIQTSNDERYYLTKDDKAVVKLKFDRNNIKMGIFTENESYPNVKVNERTGKVLADYPDLDKLPFEIINKLTSENILPKEALNQIIEKAKTDPNSALVIKDTDEGQILLDSNVFKAYKIENEVFKPIPFDDESVQQILKNEDDNNSFQEGVIRMLSRKERIPSTIPMSTVVSILKSTPYNKRIITVNDNSYILTLDESNSIYSWSLSSPLNNYSSDFSWEGNGGINRYGGVKSVESWRSYFEYLRSQNLAYNTLQLEMALTRGYITGEKFAKADPPLTEDNLYKIYEYEGAVYLINKNNPRESRKVSPSSGRLIKASINPRTAAQLLGTAAPTPTAPTTTTTGRRGRPAGGTARPATTPAPTPGGETPGIANFIEQQGLTGGFNALPTGVRNRFLNGVISDIRDDRGATRRNGALGNRGRVVGVISSGQSRFYIVRLASGTKIGSVATQPDAQHFIVTSNSAFRIPNAGAFVDQLQARNLSENAKAIISLHAEARPQDIEEIKYLLKNKKYETQ